MEKSQPTSPFVKIPSSTGYNPFISEFIKSFLGSFNCSSLYNSIYLYLDNNQCFNFIQTASIKNCAFNVNQISLSTSITNHFLNINQSFLIKFHRFNQNPSYSLVESYYNKTNTLHHYNTNITALVHNSATISYHNNTNILTAQNQQFFSSTINTIVLSSNLDSIRCIPFSNQSSTTYPNSNRISNIHSSPPRNCLSNINTSQSSSSVSVLSTNVIFQKNHTPFFQSASPHFNISNTLDQESSYCKIKKTAISMHNDKRGILKLGLLNSRSVRNKVISICETLTDRNLLACGLTETWIQERDVTIEREFNELGYSLLHRPRESKRGGGIGFLYKNNLRVDKLSNHASASFEVMEVVLKCKPRNLFISTVYRTGQLNVSERKTFIKEFELYLEMLSCRKELVIVWGDFNIHIQDKNCKLAEEFLELTTSYGFLQIVTTPTHIGGNILDLILVKSMDSVSKVSVLTEDDGICLSDHFLVELELFYSHENINEQNQKLFTYRKLHVDNFQRFKCDLHEQLLDLYRPSKEPHKNGFQEYVKNFFSCIENAVDCHSQIVTKSKYPNSKPFINSCIKQARRKKRQAERRYRKTKLITDKSALNKAARYVTECVKKCLDEFYADKFNKVKGNQRGTFKIINNILNRTQTKIYPENYVPVKLANDFEDYFTNKIELIRKEIESRNQRSKLQDVCSVSTPLFVEFGNVTDDELKSVLRLIKRKYSPVDNIPEEALSSVFDAAFSNIKYIVNFSLQNGIFPDHLKTSYITPIIKGKKLDCNSLSNYRPLSSTPFLAKIIEKNVALQLEVYLQDNNMQLDLQSAYKKNFSCETALTKVYNDVLTYLDSNTGIIMVFLDLSAAFDTIDHDLMLKKLRNIYLMDGNTLKWFKSYLENRQSYVKIDDHLSRGRRSRSGVPQGTILGPILFSMYIQDVHNIISSHGLQYHIYADDIQIYFKYSKNNHSKFHNLTNCLSDIKKWADDNYLKFNESKTNFVNITSAKSKLEVTNLDCLDEDTVFVDVVKNLGVLMDHSLNFKHQINKVCRNGFATLSSLWRVSSRVSNISTKIQIVQATIISQIDYCNSIYVCLPNSEIKKLQRLMNAAVRFIYNLRRKNNDSITHYLKKCHFLPVSLRCKFKICCLAFKCVYGGAPEYLSNLLEMKKSLPSLRINSDITLLKQCKLYSENYKNRAFSITAPIIWNELPRDLRESCSLSTFKSKLKTYYFDQF